MPYWERNWRLLQVDAGPSGNESFAKNEFRTGILQRNEMGPVLRWVYRTHGRKRITISINVSVFVTYFLSLRSHVVSYNHTLRSITTPIGQIFGGEGQVTNPPAPLIWFDQSYLPHTSYPHFSQYHEFCVVIGHWIVCVCTAWNLLSKTDFGFSTEKFQVGFEFEANKFNVPDSMLPRNMNARLQLSLLGYKMDAIEVINKSK